MTTIYNSSQNAVKKYSSLTSLHGMNVSVVAWPSHENISIETVINNIESTRQMAEHESIVKESRRLMKAGHVMTWEEFEKSHDKKRRSR